MKQCIFIAILMAGLAAADAPTTATTDPASPAPTTAPAPLSVDHVGQFSSVGVSVATQPAATANATTAPTTAPTSLAKTSSPTTAPVAAARPADVGNSSRYYARFSSPRPPIRTLLPAEYAILNDRSIFAKGHLSVSYVDSLKVTVPDPGSGYGRGRGPGPSVTVAAAVPEESLVFDGVTQADAHIVAFVEDRNSMEMHQLKVGDLVARGKVTALTLDTLDYAAGDRVVHVAIGQNLLGVRMAEPSGDTAPTAAPTTAPAANPAVPGAPGGAPPSGAPETVEDRMRRRRQQELQGN